MRKEWIKNKYTNIVYWTDTINKVEKKDSQVVLTPFHVSTWFLFQTNVFTIHLLKQLSLFSRDKTRDSFQVHEHEVTASVQVSATDGSLTLCLGANCVLYVIGC